VDQAIEDGVSEGGLVDDGVPGVDGELTGDDERAFCVQGRVLSTDQFTANVAIFDDDVAAAVNAVGNPDNIDLVNWILNQKYEGEFTEAEEQWAIWRLLDGEAPFGTDELRVTANSFFNAVNGDPVQDLADAEALLQQVLTDADAEGFEAGAGDLVGVLIDPKGGEQDLLIGIAFEDLATCDCADGKDCFWYA
jgi:hypothetical protein